MTIFKVELNGDEINLLIDVLLITIEKVETTLVMSEQTEPYLKALNALMHKGIMHNALKGLYSAKRVTE